MRCLPILCSVYCFLAISSASAECLPYPNSFPECRYPSGDEWCAINGNGNKYAFDDKCLNERTNSNGQIPYATRGFDTPPMASISGNLPCSALRQYYKDGEEWIMFSLMVQIGAIESGAADITVAGLRLADKQSEVNHELSKILSYNVVTESLFEELVKLLALASWIDAGIGFLNESAEVREEIIRAYQKENSDRLGEYVFPAKVAFGMRVAQALKHYGIFEEGTSCMQAP